MNFTEEELEILAKVEEQNKALLADEKAVFLVNTKRRAGSISSSLSNESSTDGVRAEPSGSSSSTRLNGTSSTNLLPSLIPWNHTGPPPSASLPEQWSYVMNNWEQCAKKRSVISELITKGLPDEFRPSVWRMFTGAHTSDLKKLYDGYLEMTSPVERAIRRDIARTFPKHELFKEENGFGQESLFRVIKAYSLHDNEVGYCQGSGFIAGLLLMQLPEADAFAVFAQLMDKYQLREMYKPSMLQLGVCMYQLEKLLAEHLPDLHLHFLTHSLAPTLYASAWFLTLFSTILPIPMATRVMDLFIAQGLPFIFRMALALLKFSARRLLTADMESMVVYLQNEGPAQWGRNSEVIFDSAASIKLNQRKMKKMEKEYMQIRSKEREEQIELRRLRTENGLLLQRIARLDEECTSMADRLVQSQLVRAQEAEAVLTLRCELSQLRRAMANGNHSSNGSENQPPTTAQNGHDGVDKNSDPQLKPRQSSPIIDRSPAVNGDKSVLSERRLSCVVPQSTAAKMTWVRRSTDGAQVWDTWMLSTLSRLQTELASSRAAEAEARLHLLDLKERYHTLQQSKSELAAQSSDELTALKGELCSVKLRENNLMARLHEFKERLTDIESTWKTHTIQCKASTSLLDANSLFGKSDSVRRESAQKLSDALLETHYVEEIGRLKQEVQELTVQKDAAEHRADRLQAKLQELEDQQVQASCADRGLRLELKQAVQACAEVEAQRHADMVLWRTRVMELTTELAELRQNNFQLDCKYESLKATQILAEPPELSSRRSSLAQANTVINGHGVENGTDSDHDAPSPTSDQNVTMVWKDLPPTVMTDSIGPLNDLCLVPDDPLITSVYVNSSNQPSSEQC